MLNCFTKSFVILFLSAVKNGTQIRVLVSHIKLIFISYVLFSHLNPCDATPVLRMTFICMRIKGSFSYQWLRTSLTFKLSLEATRKGPTYYLSFSLRQQQLSAVPDSVTSAGSQRACSSGHVTELRSKPPERRRVI